MSGNRTYVERVCARCAGSYRCRSDSPQVSCSPRCAAFLRHAVRAGRAAPPTRSYEERVCAQCEAPFTCRSDTGQKCCSPICAGRLRRRPPGHNEATCLRCGVVIYRPPSGLALDKGKYCSRDCRFGPPEERFLAFVEKPADPDGCWRWTGSTVSAWCLYGRMSWEGRMRLAHHVSHLLYVGPIPPRMVVRHRCPGGGNAWCVNPRHLLVGTRKQNAQDMLDAGRHWSQTGAWSPQRREADLVGETRELVVILPRTVHRKLTAKASAAGLSLQEAAVLALTLAAQD